MTLKKRIQHLKFKYTTFKCKRAHKNVINHQLKTLKFCLFTSIDIGFPVSNEECEVLQKIISLYNDTSIDMNKDIKRCKEYISNYKEITK